jgi:hypothetical protein
MMRANNGRIDHLQRRIAHSAPSERLQDHVPDAAVGPPPKLPEDRVPVAKFLRQVTPGRASSHQPKHRIEHAAMVPWRTAAATMDQERFEIRPLFVGHQSANQGCLRKSSLESIRDSCVKLKVNIPGAESGL